MYGLSSLGCVTDLLLNSTPLMSTKIGSRYSTL